MTAASARSQISRMMLGSPPIFSWRKRQKIHEPYSASPRPAAVERGAGPRERAPEVEEVDVVVDVRVDVLLHVRGRALDEPVVLQPVVGELRRVVELVRGGDLEELLRRVLRAVLERREVVVDHAERRDGVDVRLVGVRVVARAVAEDAVRAEVVQIDVQLAVAAVVGRRRVRERRPVVEPERVDLLGPDVLPGRDREVDPVRHAVGRVGIVGAGASALSMVSTQWTQTKAPQAGLEADSSTVHPLPIGTPPEFFGGRASSRCAALRSLPARSSTRAARSRRISVASWPEGRSTSPNSRRTRARWKMLRARSSVYSASVSSPSVNASLSASSAATGAGSGRSASWAAAVPDVASRTTRKQAVRPARFTGNPACRICRVSL